MFVVFTAHNRCLYNRRPRYTRLFFSAESAERVPSTSWFTIVNIKNDKLLSEVNLLLRKRYFNFIIQPNIDIRSIFCELSRRRGVRIIDKKALASLSGSTMSDFQRVFLFVGFEQAKDLKAKLINDIISLGGKYLLCENYRETCSHLVCVQPWPICKQKFLSAAASGKWIIVPEYIIDSNQKHEWLNEEPYEWGSASIKSMAKIHPNLPGEIVLSPKRNRLRIKFMGFKNIFSDWKCAVIIEDERKRKAYEVILACGGAKIIKPKMPIRKPLEIIRSTTHLFIEKHIPCQSQLLLITEGGVFINTDYIRSYILYENPPDVSEYYVKNYSKNNDELATPAKEKFIHRQLCIRLERLKENDIKKRLWNSVNDSLFKEDSKLLVESKSATEQIDFEKAPVNQNASDELDQKTNKLNAIDAKPELLSEQEEKNHSSHIIDKPESTVNKSDWIVKKLNSASNQIVNTPTIVGCSFATDKYPVKIDVSETSVHRPDMIADKLEHIVDRLQTKTETVDTKVVMEKTAICESNDDKLEQKYKPEPREHKLEPKEHKLETKDHKPGLKDVKTEPKVDKLDLEVDRLKSKYKESEPPATIISPQPILEKQDLAINNSITSEKRVGSISCEKQPITNDLLQALNRFDPPAVMTGSFIEKNFNKPRKSNDIEKPVIKSDNAKVSQHQLIHPQLKLALKELEIKTSPIAEMRTTVTEKLNKTTATTKAPLTNDVSTSYKEDNSIQKIVKMKRDALGKQRPVKINDKSGQLIHSKIKKDLTSQKSSINKNITLLKTVKSSSVTAAKLTPENKSLEKRTLKRSPLPQKFRKKLKFSPITVTEESSNSASSQFSDRSAGKSKSRSQEKIKNLQPKRLKLDETSGLNEQTKISGYFKKVDKNKSNLGKHKSILKSEVDSPAPSNNSCEENISEYKMLIEFIESNYKRVDYNETPFELPEIPKGTRHCKIRRDMELPRILISLFKSCTEEKHLDNALDFSNSLAGSTWYPDAYILNTLVRLALQNPDDENLSHKMSLQLNTITQSHPPFAMFLSDIYLRSLCVSKENPVAPWNTLSEIISGCILNQINCKSLLEFFVEIITIDYQCFLKNSKDLHKTLTSKERDSPIIATIIWYTTAAGTVSTPCTELVAFIAQALSINDIFEEYLLLNNLLEMVAECIRLAESSYVEGDLKMQQNNLVNCIVTKCRLAELEPIKLGNIIGNLKPMWLRLAVATETISKLPILHFRDKNQYFRDPISLRKIVYYYFKPSLSPETPLKKLSQSKFIDLCQSPIKSAAVNKRNRKGESQLHGPCMRNEVERLNSLLAIPGVDINIKDFAGWTPLHEAANHGNVNCVRLLLNWKPRDSLSDRYSKEPLDIYACNDDGISALHDAVLNNHLEVAELLLNRGGKKLANIKSKKGVTPLSMAKTEAMIELIDRVCSANPDSVPDEELETLSNAEQELLNENQFACFLTLLTFQLESYLIVYQIKEIQEMVVKVSEHEQKEINQIAVADSLDEIVNVIRKRKVGAKEVLRLSSDLAIFEQLPEYLKTAKIAWANLTTADLDSMLEYSCLEHIINF